MPQKSMGDYMQALFKQFVADGRMRECELCPHCAVPMLVFYDRKNKRDRSLPACPRCGFKVTDGAIPQTESEEQKITKQAAKKDALNYFVNSSVFSDKSVVDKSFENYQVTNQRQQQAKHVAEQIVQDVVADQPVSGIFTGATGTGKTHLSMAIIYEVLRLTDYRKRCIFVNYRELLNQMKQGISDPQMQKQMASLVTREIKRADLVVIDDLGAEVGDDNGNSPATRYDMDAAISIYDARASKATITTTNRTGAELKRIYGSRVVSRMTEHSLDHTYLFTGMQDYRMQGARA